MTEGAGRCRLIKPVGGAAAVYLWSPEAEHRGCVGFSRNANANRPHRPPPPPLKKRGELKKMSFLVASFVLGTSHVPAPPPYLRNAKQQGATEDLQISGSQRGWLSRAAMSN